MVPTAARFRAISVVSNLGHNIPGLSRRRILLLVFNQERFLVTPGMLPTLTTFLPAKRFIRVDLPTFGTPTTKTLISFFFKPLAKRFSWVFCINSLVLLINF